MNLAARACVIHVVSHSIFRARHDFNLRRRVEIIFIAEQLSESGGIIAGDLASTPDIHWEDVIATTGS
jgi:hypothetical protein